MKKANVVLSLVLALVIMFNIGVVLYERGHADGYEKCFVEDMAQIDQAYEYGLEDGVQMWDDHTKAQEELKIKNEMKDIVSNFKL